MKKRKVGLHYDFVSAVEVPEKNLLSVLSPNVLEGIKDENSIIEDALNNPINSPRLSEIANAKGSVLILVDDITRKTPAQKILPFIIDELIKGKVDLKKVRLMAATGTHRPMTVEEKERKCGRDIVRVFDVLNHNWMNEDEIISLEKTSGGIDIEINRAVVEADLVIGIGQIVPHRVPGFSGGAKIVQPGVCGEKTTGQTHWLSAGYDGEDILGEIENPVRKEIDEVGCLAGLAFIVNTIHDGTGKIRHCVAGDPIKAFREGAAISKEIYQVPLAEKADIVIVETYPADLEMWQAAKGIFNADICMKKGGVMIIVSPCSEGVAVAHPSIEDIGYLGFSEVNNMVETGELTNLTVAAHIAHVGRIIADKGKGILISRGIDNAVAKRMGFFPECAIDSALNRAFEMKGHDASVVVLQCGGEILPVVGRKKTDKNNVFKQRS